MSSNTIYVDPMVLHTLAQAKHILPNISFEERSESTPIQAERMFSGDQGRPSFFISKEQSFRIVSFLRFSLSRSK